MRASARGWARRDGPIRRFAAFPRETSLGELEYAVSALRGESASDVALKTLAYCFGRFGLPSAAWAAEAPSGDLALVGAVGFDARREGGPLANGLSRVRRWRSLAPVERSMLLSGFARAAGHRIAEALDAEDILVLVAGPSRAVSRRLREVRGFLLELMPPIVLPESPDRPDRLVDALAFASHELRGPLLAAKAAVERALVEPQSPDARSLLTRSVEDLDRLAREVSQVLEWASEVEAIVPRPTSVEDIVRDALASATVGADATRISVSGADHLTVMVDRRSMSSSIANLIRNALAYSPPWSPIAIRIVPDERTVSISVSDSGPGIPLSEHDRVFDPFARGRSGSSSPPGVGLGLFIAKKVVNAHAGRIFIEPTEHGTTFTIELPNTGHAE